MSETSTFAPVASIMASIVKDAHPELQPQEIVDIFRASATETVQTPGGYSVPVINLESALEYANRPGKALH